MVKVQSLTRIYKTRKFTSTALNDTSMTFNNNGLYLITGISGSGKTTLLHVLAGLDNKYNGKVLVNDKDIKTLSESELSSYRLNNVSVVFQNFGLLENNTVKENIDVACQMRDISYDEVLDEYLELLSLDKYLLNKLVKNLSLGQQQRVSILRSLIRDTDILILDEPTGNVDNTSKEAIWNTIETISRSKLVIVSTHDSDVIEKYKDREIRLYDGKVEYNNINREEASEKGIFDFQPYKITKKQFKLYFTLVLDSYKKLKPRMYFLMILFILIFSLVIVLITANSYPYEVSILNTMDTYSNKSYSLTPLVDKDENVYLNKSVTSNIVLNDFGKERTGFIFRFSEDNIDDEIEWIVLSDGFQNNDYFEIIGDFPSSIDDIVVTDYMLHSAGGYDLDNLSNNLGRPYQETNATGMGNFIISGVILTDYKTFDIDAEFEKELQNFYKRLDYPSENPINSVNKEVDSSVKYGYLLDGYLPEYVILGDVDDLYNGFLLEHNYIQRIISYEKVSTIYGSYAERLRYSNPLCHNIQELSFGSKYCMASDGHISNIYWNDISSNEYNVIYGSNPVYDNEVLIPLELLLMIYYECQYLYCTEITDVYDEIVVNNSNIMDQIFHEVTNLTYYYPDINKYTTTSCEITSDMSLFVNFYSELCGDYLGGIYSGGLKISGIYYNDKQTVSSEKLQILTTSQAFQNIKKDVLNYGAEYSVVYSSGTEDIDLVKYVSDGTYIFSNNYNQLLYNLSTIPYNSNDRFLLNLVFNDFLFLFIMMCVAVMYIYLSQIVENSKNNNNVLISLGVKRRHANVIYIIQSTFLIVMNCILSVILAQIVFWYFNNSGGLDSNRHGASYDLYLNMHGMPIYAYSKSLVFKIIGMMAFIYTISTIIPVYISNKQGNQTH